MKEHKYFWCSGSVCGFKRHPYHEIALEYKGKRLCSQCVFEGLRLRDSVAVYKIKSTEKTSADSKTSS